MVSFIGNWRSWYLTLLIAVGALGLGLSFSFTDLGKSSDGRFLDILAPLLGYPRQADDLLVVLVSEKDYSAAVTPLALRGRQLAPLLRHIASGGPDAIGLDLILPSSPWLKSLKIMTGKYSKPLT